MRKVTYICNRCRKPILGTPVKILALDINRDTNVATFSKDKYPEMMGRDFCEDCAERFRNILTEECKAATPVVKAPDFENAMQEAADKTCSKEKPDTEKKKIDIGKVHALKKAGWSVKKIADEMRCSQAAVYNALKKEPEPVVEEPEEEEW